MASDVDSFDGDEALTRAVAARAGECQRDAPAGDAEEEAWAAKWRGALEIEPAPCRAAPRRPECVVRVERDGEYIRDRARRTKERVEAAI